MYVNPFVAKLRATDDEIEKAGRRRADLVEQVAWATRFDPEAMLDEIARLRSELEAGTAELGRLEAELRVLEDTSRQLASETPALARDARLGFGVFRWFTADHRRARGILQAHKRKLADLAGRVEDADDRREEVVGSMAKLTERISENEQAIARFTSFRPVEADEAIARIDAELSLLRTKRDDLQVRAAAFDRAVEAPLAQLREYESKLEEHESAISALRSEQAGLEGRIAEAERFDKKLSRAAKSYERAKLHEECGRRLGDRSPRAILRDLRSQMRSLSRTIGDHERQIDRIRRDMAKTTQRVADVAAVAAREIHALVIDGNNCCYQGKDFIGLGALIPMTANLAESYAVTVVFDAAIRRLLGVDDDDLRSALPAAAVHVVGSRAKADETILDAAAEPTTWVVSNDRFGEYRDKVTVEEGRLIQHDIVRGRVLVHELGVNEPLAVPNGR